VVVSTTFDEIVSAVCHVNPALIRRDAKWLVDIGYRNSLTTDGGSINDGKDQKFAEETAVTDVRVGGRRSERSVPVEL